MFAAAMPMPVDFSTGIFFATAPELRQGNVLHLDWVPASGMVLLLNDRKILDPIRYCLLQRSIAHLAGNQAGNSSGNCRASNERRYDPSAAGKSG